MNTKTIKRLMTMVPLDGVDAARLVMECVEGLGARAEGLPRVELMELVRRVMREGMAAVRAAERTVPFEQAAWESVEARAGRRPTTTRDLRYYLRKMLKYEGFAQLSLRAVTVGQCREMLQAVFGHSAHSYRKGRAILHSIFAYGQRREWCDGNPVARIEAPQVVEQPIAPLSNEEVGRLRETVERRRFRDMRFSLSLLLYSGVRPAEVERLRPEDVCWEERQVIIRPQRSKTGGGRVVPLRALPGMRAQDYRVPRNWQKHWRELRRAAGFDRWRPDVCRHSFASYHAAHFRNLPELQMEMGHRDLSLLRSRYMAPTSRREASQYWKNCR